MKKLFLFFLGLVVIIFSLNSLQIYANENNYFAVSFDNEYNFTYLHEDDFNDSVVQTTSFTPSNSELLEHGIIFDDDDRVVIKENQSNYYPYRSVCRITVSYDEEPGTIYYGTGVLVGHSTILTACHVVYHEDYKWFSHITFDFGTYRDESTGNQIYTYDRITSWSRATCDSYYDTLDANDDWAIIDLNSTIGNELGYMGVSSNLSEGDNVKLYGYHGDLNGNLAYGFGNITTCYTYKFYHTCDTYGGSSGGPITIGSNTIVGIQHGYFTNGSNAIACKVSTYIVGWINDRINAV